MSPQHATVSDVATVASATAATQATLQAMQSTLRYVAIADKTVSNTTVETSVLASSMAGQGLTIPANRLAAGTTLSISGYGLYTTPLVAPGNLVVKVRLGTTVLLSTAVDVLVSAITSPSGFDFNCLLTCRTVGASGIIAPTGKLNFITTLGSQVTKTLTGTSNATVDTTVDNTLDVTLQWAVASTDRSVTARSMVVTLIN